jgi:hypothetical protein
VAEHLPSMYRAPSLDHKRLWNEKRFLVVILLIITYILTFQ